MEREAVVKRQIEAVDKSVNKLIETIEKEKEIIAENIVTTFKEGCNNYGEVQRKISSCKLQLGFESKEKKEMLSEVIDMAVGILNKEIFEIKLVDSTQEKETEEIKCIEEIGAEQQIEETTQEVIKMNQQQDNEIEKFLDYLNKEEKELENIIMGIESKGEEMTLRERSAQCKAEISIEVINNIKCDIDKFKECKELIREKYQKEF